MVGNAWLCGLQVVSLGTVLYDSSARLDDEGIGFFFLKQAACTWVCQNAIQEDENVNDYMLGPFNASELFLSYSQLTVGKG